MRRLASILACICLLALSSSAQDAIYFSTEHVYRVWTTVGTNSWTAPTNFNADGSESNVLLVGGGGGSAASFGGGGGAGGLIWTSVVVEAGSNYALSVGSGGLGVRGGSTFIRGSNGAASSFGSLVAIGGGGGGGFSLTGLDGGSGGGGGGRNNQAGGASTQTGGYGSAGGTCLVLNKLGTGAGGGGGGAMAAGANAVTSNVAGAGGAGMDLTAWLGGVALGDAGWFSGGGGGASVINSNGIGGAGGGGAGAENGVAGLPGTGGGGGGGSGNSTAYFGGAGGSGIVVVRTPLAEDPYRFVAQPTNPTNAAMLATNSTMFAWNPPAEGTPTNYAVYIGSSETNLSLFANAGTGTTVAIDFFAESQFTPVFWRVDAQGDGSTATGVVMRFSWSVGYLKVPTVFVSPSGLNIAPYWNWTYAATTIPAALAVATNGDTVLVAPGTYAHDGRPAVSNLTLKSLDGASATRIAGRINLVGTNAVLDGFTFREVVDTGTYLTAHAAVFVPSGSTGDVINCVFVNCTNMAGPSCIGAGWLGLAASNCVFICNYSKDASGTGADAYRTWRGMIDCTFVGSYYYAAGGSTNSRNNTFVGANVAKTTDVYSSNDAAFYCFLGNTWTNPPIRGAAFYAPGGTQTWTTGNTGPNFPFDEAIYGGIGAFAPKANSEIRKQNLGALPFEPPAKARAAHRIVTGGR